MVGASGRQPHLRRERGSGIGPRRSGPTALAGKAHFRPSTSVAGPFENRNGSDLVADEWAQRCGATTLDPSGSRENLAERPSATRLHGGPARVPTRVTRSRTSPAGSHAVGAHQHRSPRSRGRKLEGMGRTSSHRPPHRHGRVRPARTREGRDPTRVRRTSLSIVPLGPNPK
jgi:hypothetical protein